MVHHADALEEQGHRVLRLNTGNPALFGFEAPEAVLRGVMANLEQAHGYTESAGLLSARLAVAEHYTQRNLSGISPSDIYLGNGVSELASMAVQGLMEDGDEVLIPSPDFPLWTAITALSGGRPVHYRCDESADWMPDIDDLSAKITERTRAMVIINPNNPTGAVYSRGVLEAMLDLARRHGLVVFADEIYDQILYDGVVHHNAAAVAPDVLCLTFSGLSKAYRVAGFRSGWMVVSGPKQHARDYLEGIDTLASMRLCANAPGQFAIEAALASDSSINELVLPGGRLHTQRDRAWQALNEIPGVSCVKPQGALYAFPRLDPAVYRIENDEQFVLELLLSEKIQIVQGTGFNWPDPDHFRILTLPEADVLTDAISRIGTFLESRTWG